VVFDIQRLAGELGVNPGEELAERIVEREDRRPVSLQGLDFRQPDVLVEVREEEAEKAGNRNSVTTCLWSSMTMLSTFAPPAVVRSAAFRCLRTRARRQR
jgi:hypothetical protein